MQAVANRQALWIIDALVELDDYTRCIELACHLVKSP